MPSVIRTRVVAPRFPENRRTNLRREVNGRPPHGGVRAAVISGLAGFQVGLLRPGELQQR
jgi:hypothetical protein